nr:MAG TPA: DnaB-like replicative helicase [Bacteriophage sp.]
MNNDTLEYELLALIVNYPELLEKNILKKEYFIGEDRIMFEAILTEYKKHKVILAENLNKYNGMDINYYFRLITDNLWNTNKEIKFEELQKGIIDKYKRRKFKEIADTYNGNYEKTIEDLEKLLEINYQENSYIKSDDVMNSLFNERRQLKLGYEEFDKDLNLSQNDLLIIGAGSGTGKTAFALNLLLKLNRDYQCVYFNMEMSKDILYKRLIAIRTGISLKALNNVKNLNPNDLEKVSIASGDLENIILINGSINTPIIKKNILNVKSDKHIVVFLDHIGLIKASGNSLYEKMTNVAKDLRTICLDCNCTIIGLCQLSRESQKSNEMPKLQSLRDSGEIEQSARKVILLYDTEKDSTSDTHDMKMIIAKNDDGSRIVKDFIFERYTQRFKEVK